MDNKGDRMSRRTVIGAAGLAAGAVAAEAAEPAAPPAKHVKGPLVWLDLDQQELDDAYNQAKYAPNRDQMNRRRVSGSAAVRERLGARAASPMALRRSTASTSISRKVRRPGADRGLRARRRLAARPTPPAAVAASEPFVRAGAHFAVVDFPNVTETGGDPCR